MEKIGKGAITLLWAFGLLLPFNGKVLSAQEHGTHVAKGPLGTVEFPVSCTAGARESFTRGVALLHSLTYEESEEAFRDAAARAPRCAMANWGLAMTEYHQLWEPHAGPAELQRGSAEIQRARVLKPGTPREKDYAEALGVFYDGWEQRSHAARAMAYRDAMRGVHERNPKDQEAAIFDALALVATAAPEDKTYGNQRKAAGILEPVFAAPPDHPGVAHYLIHAYDNPALAPQGVAAARAYSKIAPGLPHAWQTTPSTASCCSTQKRIRASPQSSRRVAKDSRACRESAKRFSAQGSIETGVEVWSHRRRGFNRKRTCRRQAC